jgi:hypothetical protein
LVTQSTILAYLDVISVLAAGSVCMIPLVFFMKNTNGRWWDGNALIPKGSVLT